MSRFSELSVQDQVHTLYSIYYGRPADVGGLNFWANRLANTDASSTIGAFGNSQESRALFNGIDTTARVNLVYQTVLGRDADDEGLVFYSDLIDRNAITLADLAVVVFNGVQSGNPDEEIVLARLDAAKQFTNALNTEAEQSAYSGDLGVQAGRAYLAGISTATDAENADPDFALAKLIAGPAGSGQQFVLTTASDDLVVATSGNDTITAALGTLQAGDIIQDSSAFDNDVLNIIQNTFVGAPRIIGIENINVQWTGTGRVFFDATSTRGAGDLASTTSPTLSLAAGSPGFNGDAVVFNAGDLSVVSGAGIINTLGISGIEDGSVMTGLASTLQLSGLGESSALVNVGSALTVIEAFDLSDGVTLSLASDADITLSGNNQTYAVRGAGSLSLETTTSVLNAATFSKANTGSFDITFTDTSPILQRVDLSNIAASSLRFNAALGDDLNSVVLELPSISNLSLDGADNNVIFLSPIPVDAINNPNALNLTLTNANAGVFSATNIGEVNISAQVVPAANAPTPATLTISSLFLSGSNLTLSGENNLVIGSDVGDVFAQTIDASGTVGSLTAFAMTDEIIGAQDNNNLTLVGSFSNRATVQTHAGNDTLVLGNILTQIVDTGSGNDVVYADLPLFDGESITANLGSGNDTIEVSSSSLNISGGALVIDGDAGNDTLAFAGSVDLSQTTLFTNNIQTLELLNRSALDDSSADPVENTTTVLSTLVSGVSFQVVGQANGTTADDILIVMGSDRAETIDLSTLVVTQNQANSVLLSVNAGDGNDIIRGSSIADTLSGHAGNDSLTGGAGADILSGGAGIDTFVIGNTDAGAGAAAADTITDFASGIDKLKLGVAASAANLQTVGPGFLVLPGDDFGAAQQGANTAFATDFGGGLEYVFVTVNGNGYLFIDNGADGNAAEQAIILQGVTAIGITDIIA